MMCKSVFFVFLGYNKNCPSEVQLILHEIKVKYKMIFVLMNIVIYFIENLFIGYTTKFSGDHLIEIY